MADVHRLDVPWYTVYTGYRSVQCRHRSGLSGLRSATHFGPPSSSCRLATAVDCRILLRMADQPIAAGIRWRSDNPGCLQATPRRGLGAQKMSVEPRTRAEPGSAMRLSNNAAKDGGNAARRGLGVANRQLTGTTLGPLQLADTASSAAVRDRTLHCGRLRRSARRTKPGRSAPSCVTLVVTAARQNGSGLVKSCRLLATSATSWAPFVTLLSASLPRRTTVDSLGRSGSCDRRTMGATARIPIHQRG